MYSKIKTKIHIDEANFILCTKDHISNNNSRINNEFNLNKVKSKKKTKERMDQQDNTEPTKKRKHSSNSYASTSTVNPKTITVFKRTAYFKSSNLTEYKELIHRTLLNELNKYHVNITAKSIDIIEPNSLLLLKIRTYNKQDYDRINKTQLLKEAFGGNLTIETVKQRLFLKVTVRHTLEIDQHKAELIKEYGIVDIFRQNTFKGDTKNEAKIEVGSLEKFYDMN